MRTEPHLPGTYSSTEAKPYESTGIRLWRRWTLCAAAVTTVEYFTGVLVNLRLGWNIWNYADRPLNVLGQICPLYSLFWFGLSIPGVWLGRTVRQKLAARQTQ